MYLSIKLYLDGSTFKLKGCILTMSFLDCNGALIPYSYESWKDENADVKDRNSMFFIIWFLNSYMLHKYFILFKK